MVWTSIPSLSFLNSKVPLYQEPSGLSIPQSSSIERFLAKKHGLAGGRSEEEVDAIAEGVNDLANKIREARWAPEGEKEKKVEQVRMTVIPQWFSYFEHLLAGKKYFAGDQFTYADLKMYFLFH